MSKKKTFHLRTLAYYPVDLFIEADSKNEAINKLENMDSFQEIEQEHNVAEWQFDNFYNEDIKEFEGRRKIKTRTALNRDEMTAIYTNNMEGLDENMWSKSPEWLNKALKDHIKAAKKAKQKTKASVKKTKTKPKPTKRLNK